MWRGVTAVIIIIKGAFDSYWSSVTFRKYISS